MLPLHGLVRDEEVAYLEVETETLSSFGILTHRRGDLLDDSFDSGRVSEAHGRNRRHRKLLDAVFEQIIDLGAVELVETTNSLL